MPTSTIYCNNSIIGISTLNKIIPTTRQRLYVANYGSHRVQVLGPDGTFLWQLGNGNPGAQQSKEFQRFFMDILTNRSASEQFNHPFDVAVNSLGWIYVSDSWNHRIQVFSPDGHFVSCFGKYGHSQGQFEFPRGIAIDSKVSVYHCCVLSNDSIKLNINQSINQSG